ncbi:hypothetical protein [Nocardia sp. NPDC052566]
MSAFRAFRWDRSGAATVFVGPVSLWNWAEAAVLHGRGPTVWELC